jgi:hypothetical protein
MNRLEKPNSDMLKIMDTNGIQEEIWNYKWKAKDHRLRLITHTVNSNKVQEKYKCRRKTKKVQDNRHLEILLFTVTKS